MFPKARLRELAGPSQCFQASISYARRAKLFRLGCEMREGVQNVSNGGCSNEPATSRRVSSTADILFFDDGFAKDDGVDSAGMNFRSALSDVPIQRESWSALCERRRYARD